MSNEKGFFGVSARYQSALQNVDVAFLELEKFGAVDWGLMEWLSMNYNDETESWDYYNYETNEWSEDPIYKLPWVVDLRAGYNVSENTKVSLVISNLFNEEYSIRPLAIESPRLVNFVWTYEIQ